MGRFGILVVRGYHAASPNGPPTPLWVPGARIRRTALQSARLRRPALSPLTRLSIAPQAADAAPSRSRVYFTCDGPHLPPRGLGVLASFSAAAIWRSEALPRRIPSTVAETR